MILVWLVLRCASFSSRQREKVGLGSDKLNVHILHMFYMPRFSFEEFWPEKLYKDVMTKEDLKVTY